MDQQALPLSRYTVLDLTIARAGPTAVRLLADWGANIIRIEAPVEGDIAGSRQGPDSQNLHRNKRSLCLNLKSSEGNKVFADLVKESDVVVENFRVDVKHRLKVDYDSVKQINPAIVYASISGFGQTGPYSKRPAVDQVIQGMSGLMSITGEPGKGPMRAGIAVSDTSEFAINTELLLKDGEDIKSLEGKPSPDGKGTIQIKKGIEVGHIFKLGEIYADSMKANVLNNEGKASTLFMGCYGIGVSRLVAAAIEQNNDEKGIIWPHSIAPYDINIIAIGYDKNKEIASVSNDLYFQLKEMGYEVLLDDRKDGYGTKIKDSELIGIPLNIIIGKQFTENKEVELKSRSGESSINPISDIETILDFFKDK